MTRRLGVGVERNNGKKKEKKSRWCRRHSILHGFPRLPSVQLVNRECSLKPASWDSCNYGNPLCIGVRSGVFLEKRFSYDFSCINVLICTRTHNDNRTRWNVWHVCYFKLKIQKWKKSTPTLRWYCTEGETTVLLLFISGIRRAQYSLISSPLHTNTEPRTAVDCFPFVERHVILKLKLKNASLPFFFSNNNTQY